MKATFAEAGPHSMFPPQITALIRFARTSKPIACAVCGRRQRKSWTMLCPFRCGVATGFSMALGTDWPALTLVCHDHPLSPTDAVLAAIQGAAEITEPPQGSPR